MNQRVDRYQEEDEAQKDDEKVAVGVHQMAERRQKVLKTSHASLPPLRVRPPTSKQERWLATGTLIER
jgi:hypothetical protein